MMFKVGIENIDNHLELFKNKKVGLITNPTGVNRDLKSTIDILREKTDLVSLYAPEHGVRGDLQAGVRLDTYEDKETGCMVYSLYGKNKKPSYEMLKDIDVLCFDIQDVGARFYTFLYTMAYAMMAAKEFNKKFVVFDRPNPVGGIEVEGNILDLKYRSFVGYFPIVERYGLTIGEIAQLFNQAYDINCDLEVIKMSGYTRDKDYRELDFPWVLPSPNIPTIETTYAYLATCYFEGSNLSEGRGTTKPFQIIGAPWLKSKELIRKLNDLNLEGVQFRTVYFTPTFSKHEKHLCEGVELFIKDKKKFKPVKTGISMLYLVKEMHEEFEWIPPFKEGLNKFAESLMGDDFLTKRNLSLNDILKKIEKDSEIFLKMKGQYHIYE
ncbi:hypothetical protein MPAN_017110 [Mariniplasma anaerobium]|uniref:DUF1343 domain-containing protein n=2 Tax=Mariniplasma anaerobium TaxID=2735436 RepID=A0A7R7V999_9MOLU|nr:hypothetical protein MPAN_017110 [Mariniplasma anaerobium]